MKIEMTTEELRKYSIFLGTPMYGGTAPECFASQQMIYLNFAHNTELN